MKDDLKRLVEETNAKISEALGSPADSEEGQGMAGGIEAGPSKGNLNPTPQDISAKEQELQSKGYVPGPKTKAEAIRLLKLGK